MESAIAKITSGGGCPCCSGHKVVKSTSIVMTHFDLCKEWDYYKNILTPEQVSSGSGYRMWWKCEKGHSWNAVIGERIKHYSGCPICSQSNGERKIEEALKKLGIIYEYEWRDHTCRNIRVLVFDFHFKRKDKQFVVEYQGQQHYQNNAWVGDHKISKKHFEDLQKRDRIKKEWCMKNSVCMIEIPYWDFKNIEKIIKDRINEE